jgi:hypothetical protein
VVAGGTEEEHETVVAGAEVLYWRLSGGTEEEHENPVSIFFGPTEITLSQPIE